MLVTFLSLNLPWDPGQAFLQDEQHAISSSSSRGWQSVVRSAGFLAPSASRSSTSLPEIQVRAYAFTPTRDHHHLSEMKQAATARVDQARRIAAKARRDQEVMAAAILTYSKGRKTPYPAFHKDTARSSHHPNQPTVRSSALVSPSSGSDAETGEKEKKQEESKAAGDRRSRTSNRKCAGGLICRRRESQSLSMFQPAGKSEIWKGPGAYAVEDGLAMWAKEPRRLSPVVRKKSERMSHMRSYVTSDGNTDCFTTRESPCTPEVMPKWPISLAEFTPPEPKDVPHDVKENPVRSGSCFLSVTDMFELVRPFALVSPETTPSVTGPERTHITAISSPPTLPQEQLSQYDSASTTKAANPWQTSIDVGGSTACSKCPNARAGIGVAGGGTGTTRPLTLAILGTNAESYAMDASRRGLQATRVMEGASTTAFTDGLTRMWSWGRRYGVSADEGGVGGCKGESDGITSEEHHLTDITSSLKDNSWYGSIVKTLVGREGNNMGARAGASSPGGDHHQTKEDRSKQIQVPSALWWTNRYLIQTKSRASTVDVDVSEAGTPGVARVTTKDTRISAAFGLAETHPRTKLKLPKPHEGYMTRGSKGISFGKANGKSAVIENGRNGRVAGARAVMTNEALVNVGAAFAAEAATNKHRREGLIRKVGRAKRGPCMLTLTSPSKAVDQARPKKTWKPEASGGLLGPGESRILIC